MKRIISIITSALIIFSAVAAWAGETQPGTRSFKVSKGGTLKINLVTGDIKINTWDKDEVYVSIEGIDNPAERDAHQIKLTQSGNSVIIENRGGGGWPNSNDVSVSVPREFNIEAKTNQGDADLKADIKGSVIINTGGGDITVKNISGKTVLNTNGGDVTSSNINGDADISTKGGDIAVGNIGGNAQISTLGGSIKVGNVSKDISAKTNGGEIETGKIGGSADVETMGGNILIESVLKSVSAKTNGGNIKLANSSGPVSVKTLGGNLELYNTSGPVDAKSNAGNIEIELNSVGNGSSSITTMSGWVTLFINPADKATIEATARGDNDSDEKAILSDFSSKSYESGKHTGFDKASYEINGGGQTISVKTMNGGIKIKKLKK